MRDLSKQISLRLLGQVTQPSQYVGLEINARRKDPREAQVRVALAFPDAYSIGISHLGTQILYTLLNDMDGVACDRAYCPRPDAEEVMRREEIELFGWESRLALRDFDIIGFSLGYELCVTNVLTILDLCRIPLHAQERTQEHPIIVAGDAMADSPEPMADFIDLFIVGEGEEPLAALAELVKKAKAAGAGRDEILLQAAQTIPAVYVPRFYKPHYDSAGRFEALKPTRSDVPAKIQRAHLKSLSLSPALLAPLVPQSEAIHDRVAIEVMRGCPNGCRFCQAGQTRLPVRSRPIEEVLEIAQKALAATGHHEVSLLSLSTSDYPRLGELIDRLKAMLDQQHVSISLPSLRVDSQLRELPKLTSSVRKGGLTIAAEAGSERLRKAIRKNISEEDMIAGVQAAYAAGWKSVKVYFMAGLPGETPEDIDAIFDLCRRLSDARKAVDNQRGSISASVSWAVPKPHTPMQWFPMQTVEYFWEVRNRLRGLSHRTPISFKFHWIERSLLEAVLCRGDRTVGRVIEAAWRGGARFDAWDEHWDHVRWTEALAAAGVDAAAFAHRHWEPGQPMPWSHIVDSREEIILREYKEMLAACSEPTPQGEQ